MDKEINNREDVSILVNTFYIKVRQDDMLGPIFNKIILNDDWPKHLDKLTDFWETNLFGIAKFKGNPIKAHQNVDKRFNHSISQEHFGRWLQLWFETIDELFVGQRATRAKESARKMATGQFLANVDSATRRTEKVEMKLLLSITLVWIGAVLSISFFETPMKFTPEVITTELGVSIGRVIFFFFNKIEIAFSLLLLILTLKNKEKVSLVLPSVIIGIVLIQTFILLPVLDKYAVEFLASGNRGPKYLHFTYVAIEFLKLVALIVLALIVFKKFELKTKN